MPITERNFEQINLADLLSYAVNGFGTPADWRVATRCHTLLVLADAISPNLGVQFGLRDR